MRAKTLILLAAAVAAFSAPLAAEAQNPRAIYGAGRDDQEQVRKGVKSGRQAPLSRILTTIAARNPGRHLNTTLGEAGGRTAYLIQWQLDSGEVVVFVVDAESGHIMGRQGG